jgi:hypothetical protein
LLFAANVAVAVVAPDTATDFLHDRASLDADTKSGFDFAEHAAIAGGAPGPATTTKLAIARPADANHKATRWPTPEGITGPPALSRRTGMSPTSTDVTAMKIVRPKHEQHVNE